MTNDIEDATRARWDLAAARIDRDARLSELTDDEVASLIAAASGRGGVDGWKLVPVEPTPEMIDRFVSRALCVSVSSENGGWSGYAVEQWKAMLSAVPEAPTPSPSHGRMKGHGLGPSAVTIDGGGYYDVAVIPGALTILQQGDAMICLSGARAGDLAAALIASPSATPQVADSLPKQIGRLHLGERLSNGERLCADGHDIPAGHPMYWPEQISQYDDSDPRCLAHAIELTESDQGWCPCRVDAANAGRDAAAGVAEGCMLDGCCIADQIRSLSAPENGEGQ